MFCGLLPWGFLPSPAIAGAGASPLSTCPVHGAERDEVASVNQRLELVLKDGRTLRLAGFEPVRPTPDHPDFDTIARDQLARFLTNAIDVLPLAKPDRWGRVPVFAFEPAASPGAPVQPIEAWLLARGDGRFMPERAAAACQSNFLEAEAAARKAGVGLWRDPYYAVIAPADTAALAEKAATNVIVEGKVVDVDARPRRIYLLFGPRHSGALAVTIARREVGIFEQRGLGPQALVGRTIRVRGLLDLRFGPEIELTEPDAIEIVSMPVAHEHVEANTANSSEKPH